MYNGVILSYTKHPYLICRDLHRIFAAVFACSQRKLTPLETLSHLIPTNVLKLKQASQKLSSFQTLNFEHPSVLLFHSDKFCKVDENNVHFFILYS